MKKTLAILFLTTHALLCAQITQITIDFSRYPCKEKCIGALEEELQQVHLVSHYTLDPHKKTATLSINTQIPFDLKSLRLPFQKSRMNIGLLTVFAKGYVEKVGDQYELVSGQERFRLRDSFKPSNRVSSKNNSPHLYPVQPALASTLDTLAASKKRVQLQARMFPFQQSKPILFIDSIE